jgi:uncharacterized protein YjiS (DUF1127 family)
MRHPQAARAQTSHDLGGAGMRTLLAAAAIIRALAKAVIAAAGKWWRAHTIRRARIAAIRELHALDDRTLRDIGVSRAEIEWVVVYGRDAPPYWASPAPGRGSAKEEFVGQPSGPVRHRRAIQSDGEVNY